MKSNYELLLKKSLPNGDFFLSDNSIEGYTGYGIEFTQLSSMYDFGNVIINGNEIASSVAGARAIIFPATTSNWVTSVLITSNVLPNAQHGILVNAGEYLTIANNTCLDIDIGSAVTTGRVAGNTIQSGGSITNSSTSVIVPYNPGYNPVGASTISFSTSPNTYTAGASPETLYLSDSSGITALTDNGTSILPHTTGANVVLTVDLGPFETAVITSGGTLTGKKMIH